jgi:hypothetical protein
MPRKANEHPRRESVKVSEHKQGQQGGEPQGKPGEPEPMPANAEEALTQQAGGYDPNDPKLAGEDTAGRPVVTDVEAAGTEESRENVRATEGNDGGMLHDAGSPVAQAFRAPDVHEGQLADALTGETFKPGDRPRTSDNQGPQAFAGPPVVAHTPTLPLGQHQTTDPRSAQPVTMYPQQPSGQLQPANAEAAEQMAQASREGRTATIEVAQMAPSAGEATARTNRGLEVAAPAPVPSPGDPDLLAGTSSAFTNEGRPGQTEPD